MALDVDLIKKTIEDIEEGIAYDLKDKGYEDDYTRYAKLIRDSLKKMLSADGQSLSEEKLSEEEIKQTAHRMYHQNAFEVSQISDILDIDAGYLADDFGNTLDNNPIGFIGHDM